MNLQAWLQFYSDFLGQAISLSKPKKVEIFKKCAKQKGTSLSPEDFENSLIKVAQESNNM